MDISEVTNKVRHSRQPLINNLMSSLSSHLLHLLLIHYKERSGLKLRLMPDRQDVFTSFNSVEGLNQIISLSDRICGLEAAAFVCSSEQAAACSLHAGELKEARSPHPWTF